MTMIADRRAVVLALCAVLALKSAASAAGFGEAGCPEGTRRAFDEYTGRYVCAPIEPVFKPLRDKPNAALAALRAGPWGAREDDSFRVVAAGWETPNLGQNLTPPDLTPPNQWKPTPAPVPVEVRPIEAVRPVEPIRAVPFDGLTPCRDLTNKARRLRNAASQCDTDIANGKSSCIVAPEFNSPRIPRSLSANDARAYAGQFETVVNGGSERACADVGGLGSIPEAPARPLFERLKDAMNTMANDQVNQALLEYAVGGLLSKITYGPEAPWTHALKNHFYLDIVRDHIRDEYRSNPANRRSVRSDPYSLNRRSISENIRLLLRDLVAPIIGANMAYATGSINFRWEQVGDVDTWRRQVTVKFTANDELRLGSQTRVPLTEYELVDDNAFGQAGPMHTVKLEWQWTEVISY